MMNIVGPTLPDAWVSGTAGPTKQGSTAETAVAHGEWDSSANDVFGQAKTSAQRVLNIFGQKLVDRVGLVAGEDGEARHAVGGEELHDAKEAGVEREALGEAGFAVAAENAAAGG